MNPDDREKWTRGIDVSRYQGELIDWKKVADAGNAFAFVKATEGQSKVDKDFERNFEGAREAGLLVGAYHFAHAGISAVIQAEFFFKTVGLDPDLGLVLDIETNDNVGQPALATWVKTFVGRLTHLAGESPMIYTTKSFWDEFVRATGGDGPLFIARYNTDLETPPLPQGWQNFDFWQYSQKGTVPGIQGAVDLDVFNGNLDALKEWAGV